MTVEELKESILEKIDIKLDCITNKYSADDQVKTSEIIKNLVESYAMLEDSERV